MRNSKLFISPLIKKAFYYSAKKHDGQYRKGVDVPFFVHPALVAFGVSEYTDDRNIIAAAVLHDVIEDCNVSSTELTNLFNENVSKIVSELSLLEFKDAKEESWKDKKDRYIDLVKNASREALLIIAVDKMSNMSSYFDYLLSNGEKALKTFFDGTPKDYLWFYEELKIILENNIDNNKVVKDYKNLLQYYSSELLE